jgi:dTDP-D-glucose 4,6-dehydratase
VLGWTPRTSLDTGLRATIAWFAEEARQAAANASAPAASAPRRAAPRAVRVGLG